jgi:hypothetical protein
MKHALVLVLFAGCALSVFASEGGASGPALGLLMDSKNQAGLGALPPLQADRPFHVRLKAAWREIESSPANYDWSSFNSTISSLREMGCTVTLSLHGSNPLYLPDGAYPSGYYETSIPAWIGFVRSAVRNFAGEVDIIEIWDRTDGFDPAAYAFLLKNSALAARAEATAMSGSILVAQAPVSPDALEWQMELWNRDSAAYIDILPLELGAASDPLPLAESMSAFRAQSLLHPPAAALWAYVPDPGGSKPMKVAQAAILGLTAGAERVLVGWGEDPELAAWLVGADRLLAAGYAPAPLGELRIVDEQGESPQESALLGRFFSDQDFTTLVFYILAGSAGGLSSERLIVDSRHVRNARVVEPASGERMRVSAMTAAGEGGMRAVRIAPGSLPMALIYEKGMADSGFDIPPQEIESAGERELTAEEIIARHQQVQRIQDDVLERWTAAARIDFHFKFAQAGVAVDVAIDSNYFWERGGAVEWEQTDYYVNGNRVGWKNIPELPFFQPEKVATLPLDLTMDKTYEYRYVGRAGVAGRDAYVLEFQPVNRNTGASLYRGRVWIDSETFVRLKASIVQTNLEAPVIANEERDHYREEVGPDGDRFWLLDRIKGQQIWTAGGRNFVVEREVTFLSYEINQDAEEFERRRQQAYASDNQMLRDTAEGFRYLERQKDGSRVVKDELDSSQLLAAAGAFKDSSSTGVLPLAGINYFDYDVAGKGIQLNVLFAGLLAFVTATKPDLFGEKIDATIDFTGVGFKSDDEYYQGEMELLAERIRRRAQYLSGRLGFPVGSFFKFSMIGGLSWQTYYHDADVVRKFNDVREDLDLEFILPPDHTLLSGTLLAEFNRRGYNFSIAASRSWRSKWAEWGLVENLEGGGQQFCRADNDLTVCEPVSPEPVYDTFFKWNASFFKEWRLPKFQKLRAELDYLNGSDLDRFSQFGFSMLGSSSLSGFSGSGVRFDRGAILRAGYSFNVLEAVRFSAFLESALVEEERSGGEKQSFSGFGLSGNFIGPWKTVINASTGYALDSDIPGLDGEMEFMLLVFKLF